MNQLVETISLPLADVLRQASSQTLAQELLDRMKNGAAASTSPSSLPPIGTEHNGEIYAGLSIENNVPVALWLLPGEAERVTFAQAEDWAAKQGGVLPSRIDQLVLFKNVKDQFKEAWYWSGETYASGSEFAWAQNFSDGYQFNDPKSNDGRARAVRRSVIQ